MWTPRGRGLGPILRGSKDGRLVADKARMLARAVVLAIAQQALTDGSLTALGRNQQPAWEDLVQAAATYDELTAAQEQPAPVTDTDRRGQTRP